MKPKRISRVQRIANLEQSFRGYQDLLIEYEEIKRIKQEIEELLNESNINLQNKDKQIENTLANFNLELLNYTNKQNETLEVFSESFKNELEKNKKTFINLTNKVSEETSGQLKKQEERLNNFLLKVEEKIIANNKYIDDLLETKELNIRKSEAELFSKITKYYDEKKHELRSITEVMNEEFNKKAHDTYIKLVDEVLKVENDIVVKLQNLVNTEVNNANSKKIQNKALDLILDAFNKSLNELKEQEKKGIIDAIKSLVSSRLLPANISEAEENSIPYSTSDLRHESYLKLKTVINTKTGEIPMLVGPAGTGKSEAVGQLAEELGLRLYMSNRVQNSFEIIGFVDAGGNYVETQFYQAFKKGGLFFFDEVDASSPEALVTINTAISQKYMTFPGFKEITLMHPNFKIVTAANTLGMGATIQYTGRNKLDSATLNRFSFIEWNYDRELENNIIEDKDLLHICWELREKSSRYKDIIISTRSIKSIQSILLENKKTMAFKESELFRLKFFASIKNDIIKSIVESLENVENNKYYQVLKEI